MVWGLGSWVRWVERLSLFYHTMRCFALLDGGFRPADGGRAREEGAES
jgi:hypothetical protein